MSEPIETLEEREVQRLLQEAGPRPEVPGEDLAAIKAAFRKEWAEVVRQPVREPNRPWHRTAGPLLAVAATVLLAIGVGWWWWQLGPTDLGPVAQVEALQGEVLMRQVDGEDGGGTEGWRVLAADGEIASGAELRTPTGETGNPGRTALRLASGPSLRLDAGSHVRLVSATAVELERGAVYVDTGEHAGEPTGEGDAIEIRTPLGVATDVGTQFEVRLIEETPGGDALRVRVREGLVLLTQDGLSESAGVGEELTLHADGSVERASVALYGDPWSWAVQTTPAFDIEGRTLREFLDWVARETGQPIRYADPELAQAADTIVLHGSMGGVTPDLAPSVVLPGAGLEHEVVDGTLVVSR